MKGSLIRRSSAHLFCCFTDIPGLRVTFKGKDNPTRQQRVPSSGAKRQYKQEGDWKSCRALHAKALLGLVPCHHGEGSDFSEKLPDL